MHLLLVNDDGIHAPGIRAVCEAALQAGHRVSICAPDRERSAASHSVSLVRPLSVKECEIPGTEHAWASDGTPADCARLGLYLAGNVDAVISGINNGPNLGGACIYSGTVGAATEASMSGIPALASSMHKEHCRDYSAAARLTVRVAEWMMDHPLRRGEIYNLNIPMEEILGVKAAVLAPNYLDSPAYQQVETEDGVQYRYCHGINVPIDNPDCDLLTIERGYATLTKLTWNLRADAPDPDPSGIRL